MALLLLNVSKILGIAGIITVAANTIVFLRVHRKRLAPFECPIDETREVLASFPIDRDVDNEGFFFAIAATPAVLDEDSWLKFPVESGLSSSKKVDDGDESEELRSYDSNKSPTYHEETQSGCEDGSFLKSSESQADLKAKISGYQTLNKGTVIKHRNDDQTSKLENALPICADDALSGNLQVEEDSKWGKNSHETLLDEWEVLNCEQMSEKEQCAYKKVSGLPSFQEEACYSQSEMKNTLSDGTKGLSKSTTQEIEFHNSPTGKDKNLSDPTLEGLIKGSESVTQEKKMTVVRTNVHRLEEKSCLFSDPNEELHLAKKTNATVFRMGIDWSRIMPKEPVDGVENAINWEALDRYRRFIERVHAQGLRVMLTLFHHSLPPWACAYGGWKLDKTINYFLEYTRLVADRFFDLVDFWITFSEPRAFALRTYCSEGWSGGRPNLLQTATRVLSHGVFKRVMNRMAAAHLKAYDIIHETRKKTSRKVSVGISHHISFMRPYGLFDIPAVELSNFMTHFTYIDSVCSKLDFLGINYHGQEFISSAGLKLVDNEEYSETGEGIYPDGLYRVLVDYHNRYKKLNIPFIITSNGVADTTDYLRRPYILEHLLAVKAAMDKGVPVKGYCIWALSDNWELGSGIGSKFGLVAVDQDSSQKHIPRPSYHLFSEVAKSGSITKEQRDRAWADLQTAVLQGKNRLICCGADCQGIMYAGASKNSLEMPLVGKDWRFGHYHPEGLQDSFSAMFRSIYQRSHIKSRK